MQTTRKPTAARPAQAAGRYWKGKAPKGVDAGALSDSDSDEGHQDVGEDQEAIEEEEFEFAGQEEDSKADVRKGVAKMSVALRDVEVKDGKVIVGGQEEEEESEESEEEEAPKAPGESGSSEYESSSEEESEEEPPKPQFRPVFVPKRARETIKQMEAESEFSEEAIKRREEEAAQRKKESHDLVAESIKRELAEKETAENVPDIDDADGLDPAAEFEAWRTRELTRISREAEAARIREEDRLERERRAALPEEQRLKEDMERAEKSRADKPQGQQKFLQKYWHKGAFHQDADILKRHDFTEATESTIDASMLPAVMQVKNFGKRGQTKYTHLRDQDTTVKQGEFGAAAIGKGPRPAGQVGVQEGCFNCGGPHLKRDCPNPPVPTGTNASFGSRDAPAPKTWGAETMTAGEMSHGIRASGVAETRADDATKALVEETGLLTGLATEMTTGEEIIHHVGEMTTDEAGAAEVQMTGAKGRAPESTAVKDRHPLMLTRDGAWRHRPVTLGQLSIMYTFAVVGSGLAGLTSAYLLAELQPRPADAEFEVHIFERSSVLGMDAESLTVKVQGSSETERENVIRVDVPMRSIQAGTVRGASGPYAKLTKFYDHLGVALKMHNYSYSFSSRTTGGFESKDWRVRTHMLYNGDSGRAGVGVPSTVYAAQGSKPFNALFVLVNFIRWLLAALVLGIHYIRLLFLSRPASRTPTHLCRETLKAWTQRTTRQNFISRILGWEAFVEDVVVPLFSAVCTTSISDIWEHPAAEILDYIWLSLKTHHHHAAYGVRDIVSRLASPIPQRNVHLSAEVDALIANTSESTTSVSFRTTHTNNPEVCILSGFSHIILATPTQHSANLIRSFVSTLNEKSTLRAPLEDAICKLKLFRTHKTTVITHRDASVLPNHQSDWRDLNLVLETSETAHHDEKTSATMLTPGCAMATHIFPTPSGPPLCQTTNPVLPIRPELILSQSILDRSVLTIESKIARDSFSRPLGDNEWTQGDLQGLKMHETDKSPARIWLCGAWAYGGIPLLEGCVGSAEIVVRGILELEGYEHPALI
ncbi:unnamed protein product [Rhizoctonia solani]|uniref:Micro-fibrillar-associated protein 1 C-terminal domain-containing protein n=1 Tax=Rhizoctonia solani TaxID=456999 RepID=A0A8H3HYG0_9AGAM|nr:unnamed protein product [Rhizoctonia solani]